MLKELPIGYDNFKEVIEENLYYVDKTDIISDLLTKKNKVSLFPRPRRFGKSLFISMLDNFFNIEYSGMNNKLFDGLKISKSKYYNELSTRPVILLDFKSLKNSNYDSMYSAYKTLIYNLYQDKEYMCEYLTDTEKKLFDKFINKTADEIEYQQAVFSF